jgi:hypothetical protein
MPNEIIRPWKISLSLIFSILDTTLCNQACQGYPELSSINKSECYIITEIQNVLFIVWKW